MRHENVGCLCNGAFRFALTLLLRNMKFSFLVKEIETKTRQSVGTPFILLVIEYETSV
jgi:hypothetical protein